MSRTRKDVGAGITITSSDGKHLRFIYLLKHECSNNQIEYEALIVGLRILAPLRASVIQVMGDSQLVIRQLMREYKCQNPNLLHYHETTNALLQQFTDAVVIHIFKEENEEANNLAQLALGFRISQSKTMSQISQTLSFAKVAALDQPTIGDDW